LDQERPTFLFLIKFYAPREEFVSHIQQFQIKVQPLGILLYI